MKMILDLPDELLERIHLVRPNVSIFTFITMAIENQINLEGDPTIPNNFKADNSIKKGKVVKFEDPDLTNKSKLSEKGHKPKSSDEIIPKVNLDKIQPIELKFPFKDTIIWGQYNKFFPIKFGLRYLCYKIENDNKKFVSLNEFQAECAKKASQMKDFLILIDQKKHNKRGDKLSDGLPDNNENSHRRYIGQVLGFRTSKGDPVGGIPTLGFAEIFGNQIGISKYGLDFAKIENPILDFCQDNPTLLSKDEQKFLINHIKDHLPEETKAIKFVLKLISENKNTPSLINLELSNYSGIGDKANTIRTGLLSRIHDLGLINRENIGINSYYKITDFGIHVRDSL